MSNLIIAVVTILFSGFYLRQTFTTAGPGSQDKFIDSMFWPQLLLFLMLLLGFVLLLKAVREMKQEKRYVGGETEASGDEGSETALFKHRFWLVFIIILLYVPAIQILGFVIATPIVILLTAGIMGMVRWRNRIVTAVIASACLIMIFPIALNVPMPRGAGLFRGLSLFFY